MAELTNWECFKFASVVWGSGRPVGSNFQTEATFQLVKTSLRLRHLSHSVWSQASVQALRNADCRAWEERRKISRKIKCLSWPLRYPERFSHCWGMHMDLTPSFHAQEPPERSWIMLQWTSTELILPPWNNCMSMRPVRHRSKTLHTHWVPDDTQKIESLSPLCASASSSSSNQSALPGTQGIPMNPHMSPEILKRTAPGSSWPSYVLLSEMHILAARRFPSIPPSLCLVSLRSMDRDLIVSESN